MQNKDILVTGGTGFIGSNLANTLAEQNTVTVIDDGYLGTPDNLRDGIEYYDQSVLEDNLPVDVDIVFHLAALSSYRMHEENPQRGARVNVEGFVNVVEQARNEGCDTIVYASTSSIYGNQTTPSPTTMDVTVNTGYEASKMARETYAEYFHNHYDSSLAGMRFFSVYQGYGGTEQHKGEFANVISQFANDLANGETPVIYGDGTQTRDFTHVTDVVSALTAAAEHKLNGIYNVGTGDAISFNTLVEKLNNILGTTIEPEYIENPIPDDVYVHDTCADTTPFTKETGWTPTVPLDEGLERVCEPYLN